MTIITSFYGVQNVTCPMLATRLGTVERKKKERETDIWTETISTWHTIL
jgi:hypothetical protein